MVEGVWSEMMNTLRVYREWVLLMIQSQKGAKDRAYLCFWRLLYTKNADMLIFIVIQACIVWACSAEWWLHCTMATFL